ncbi:peptidylprolyl isomerase [Lachnospiraceae bacterium]|nr:peptidylprolyl isomerase [Lachnospiraceae bacterium]
MSEKILAVAAGHEITEQELENLIDQYPANQQMYMSDDNARRQILEQLIAFHLFYKMAVEEKITESQEYLDLVEKLKTELASQMAAASVVEDISVDEEEEKNYYRDNPKLFASRQQVSARHILVESEALARSVAQEIAGGLAFAEAARKYSTCPSKERGGDLGYFSKGQMAPEFEQAAFAGGLNQVLGPVKTQFGYHLIMVEDKKEGTALPFEQVQSQIHRQLIQKKQQNAYDEKVKELAEKYGVERKEA